MNRFLTIKSFKWAATTLLFVMSTILSISYGGVILAGITFLVLMLHAGENGLRIRFRYSPIYVFIVVFALYCGLSSLWAEIPQYATRHVSEMLEIMLMLVVLFSAYRDSEDNVVSLLKAFMWRGYIISAYVLLRYGVTYILYILRNDIRLDSEVLNANTIGMAIAYSIIINVYFIFKEKKFKLYDVLIFAGFILLVATESRKGLVLVAGGVVAVFVLFNWDNKKVVNSVFKTIVVLIVLVLLMVIISKLPFMSGIMSRMSDLVLLLTNQGGRGLTGYNRIEYVKLGMNLFKEHPLLGIGIDNSRIYTAAYYSKDHYLHNNFVELLACGGIVGFFLYYVIHIHFLRNIFRMKRCFDKESAFCIIMIICMLVMDYGLVSYTSKSTYFLLLIMYLELAKVQSRFNQSSLDGERVFAR